MKKSIFALCCCVAVSLFAQSPDEAIELLINESGFGDKAKAMGNSFTAVADDYSAIFWNPAGLTQLTGSEIHGAYQFRQDQNEIRFLDSVQKGEWDYRKLKSLGLAYKFPTVQGSLVLAFGFQRLNDYDNGLRFSGFSQGSNGLSFEMEDDEGNWNSVFFDQHVDQGESISTSGNLNAFSVGTGVMLSPNLSVGATLHFYKGRQSYDFLYSQADTRDYYVTYPADFNEYSLAQTIDTQLNGHGLTLGGLLNLSPDLKVGLAVDLPWRLKAEESYSEKENLSFDDGFEVDYEPISGEWTYVVRYPVRFRGGVCLDLDRLMLSAGFAYRDWRDVRFEVPEDYAYTEDYDYLIDENSSFSTDYRAVLSYQAGGEFRIPNSGLKIRGGYRVVPSVYRDAEASWNRVYLSGGLAWDVDSVVTLSLTLIRGEWKRFSLDSLTPDGTLEDVQSDRFQVGFTCRL